MSSPSAQFEVSKYSLAAFSRECWQHSLTQCDAVVVGVLFLGNHRDSFKKTRSSRADQRFS